jgi:hypothetical protein
VDELRVPDGDVTAIEHRVLPWADLVRLLADLALIFRKRLLVCGLRAARPLERIAVESPLVDLEAMASGDVGKRSRVRVDVLERGPDTDELTLRERVEVRRIAV